MKGANIISLLSSDGYIIINKKLAKKLGIESAILIGELCAEYMYYSNTDKLDEDGGFYSTRENIEANTTLNSYAQRKVLNELQEANIIQIKRKGIPAKNFYYINSEELEKVLTDNDDHDTKNFTENGCGDTEKTSSVNFTHQGPSPVNINNNNIKNNKNNKSNTITRKSITKNNSTETINDSADDLDNTNKSVSEYNFGIQNNKTRKPNLYEKCLAMINDYTNDSELKYLLIQYLKLTLEIKDNKLYANQWKGLLNKLSSLSSDISDQKLIVRTSIEKGWRSFYLPKKDFNNNFNNNRPVDNVVSLDDDSVNHEKATNPDGTLRYF